MATKDEDIAALRAEVEELKARSVRAGTNVPLTNVPEHAGGPGTNTVSSWSQYDQELSRRGEHPHQRGQSADWLEHPDDVVYSGAVAQRKGIDQGG